jgi:aminoglycoside phosphotransferase (APT) family kinase protein
MAEAGFEPWSERAALRRLGSLAPDLPLRIEREPRFIVSYSNDAWDLGEIVLRVCWRGDRQRLRREAAIGAALPADVGYPQVLGAGESGDVTWTLTRKASGVTLDRAWGDPDEGRVRAIMADFAERLKRVHAWTPREPVAALLAAHARSEPTGAEAVIGRDVLPLPLARAAQLVAPAKAMTFVDAGMVEAAWARMVELAAHDPFAAPCAKVVHGDATYPNILVDGAAVSAMLDFEWARLAPPWVELVAWIRILEDLRDEGTRAPPVLAWLQDDYPALFAAPRLREGLWLAELAYTLRHLVFWPPDEPEARLQRDHPLHRLRRLIEDPIAWD